MPQAGLYPKYFLGRQTYWTPVGTGEDVTQALFNEEGMVEVDKGTFSIEPFLFVDGRLVTWADVSLTQTLERGYLPIPSSEWRVGDLALRTTAFATGPCGASTLFIRYRLANDSDRARRVCLFAAVRPFQVTPTWQHWHAFGGVSQIGELAYESGAVWVDGRKQVIPLTPASGFGAATFAQGAITEYLKTGDLPGQEQVSDTFGYASGALRFDLESAPRSAREVFLAVPFGASGRADARRAIRHLEPEPEMAEPPSAFRPTEEFDRAVAAWEAKLGAFEIQLPPQAAGVVETLKTAAAHILINRDGPALHPGPRRYSRSWIRDGALMAAALARVGLPEPGRDFIRWYAGYQAPDGNLPDCADRDGCEWLPEYDSWGELIFAVMDHYRFTGDRAFLAEHVAGRPEVGRLSGNAAQPAADGRVPDGRETGLLRAAAGVHEPRGLHGPPGPCLLGRFLGAAGLQGCGRDGRDPRRRAAGPAHRGPARRLPGSTSTPPWTASSGSAGWTSCLARWNSPTSTRRRRPLRSPWPTSCIDLPRPAIDQTFDKYLEGFRARARGDTPWANYTAYEIRIIGALGQARPAARRARAAGVLPGRPPHPAWNQWPEISWRDPHGPSFIGDMPHSWIGAEYILAIRSLFAYEREADQSLVIAAGIPEDWLADGREVRVRDLPTHHGRLSYSLRREDPETCRLTLAGNLAVPRGGILVMPPLPGPLLEVQINGAYSAAFAPDWARCGDCPAELLLRSESGVEARD